MMDEQFINIYKTESHAVDRKCQVILVHFSGTLKAFAVNLWLKYSLIHFTKIGSPSSNSSQQWEVGERGSKSG